MIEARRLRGLTVRRIQEMSVLRRVIVRSYRLHERICARQPAENVKTRRSIAEISGEAISFRAPISSRRPRALTGVTDFVDVLVHIKHVDVLVDDGVDIGGYRGS